jgi:uncharacterized protein (TIGR02001 family)
MAMAAFSLDAAKSQQSDGSASFSTPVVLKAARAADMPAPAPVPQAAPLLDAKFSAGITSDYNYRGYTLSNHRPSISGDAELDYSLLFVSVSAASVQMPDLSHFQMTNTLGIRPAFGPVTVETGVAYYSYPGGANDPSYSEFYVAPSYAATSRLLVGLKLYYAPDYYRMRVWENYNSITAKYDVGSGLTISAELGHQNFGKTLIVALPNYTYGNVGFSFSYKSLTFDLFYHATTLSKQSCFLITGTGSAIGGSNGCDPAVIARLSWSTKLSEVKGSLAGAK